jgi:hypothetical protein
VAGLTINPLSMENSAGPLDPTALLAAAALADRIVPVRATRGAETAPASHKRLTQACILEEYTSKTAKAKGLHAPSASQPWPSVHCFIHPIVCPQSGYSNWQWYDAFMNTLDYWFCADLFQTAVLGIIGTRHAAVENFTLQ